MSRLALSVALVSAAAYAQTPRSFEVASVKVHTAPLTRMYDYSSSGRRVNLEAYNISMLVQDAYNIKSYQVSFAPSAQQDPEIYYDIVANAPGPETPTKSDVRDMLRSLLAERFHLKIRHGSKEMAVYSLVLGKGDAKFKESAPDAVVHLRVGVNGRNQYFEATKCTMENLVDGIRNAFGGDRPVVDRTGLTGKYDIRLEATPEFRMQRDPQPADIRVVEAVQDQLGLRMVPEKASMEILIVEHVERPTAN